MELRLRPPTQAEFDEWLPRQQAQYAAEIVASGALPLAAAEQKAIRDTTTRLPDGFRTPGQLIFRLMAGEEPAGWLWLEVPYSGGGDPHMAWVNDICLNVHGRNTIARALYDSLGYEVMSQQMKKPL